MFKIITSKDQTITWPVKVEVAADGGKINKFEFTGIFKLLSDDERDALIADERAAAEAAEAEAAQGVESDTGTPASAWKETAADTILKQMTGWKSVCDENGTPLEFNRDTLLAGLRSPHGLPLLGAIRVAITEIQSGARAKN